MKKLILCLSVILISTSWIFAQDLYFSCDTREVCYWNSDKGDYEDCTTKDESSLFKVNEDETQFTHTTADLKSAYYVTKYEYDKDNDVYVYDVTSDVGNKYTYIFDIKGDEIRVVGTADDGSIYMIVFHIKSSWSE